MQLVPAYRSTRATRRPAWENERSGLPANTTLEVSCGVDIRPPSCEAYRHIFPIHALCKYRVNKTNGASDAVLRWSGGSLQIWGCGPPITCESITELIGARGHSRHVRALEQSRRIPATEPPALFGTLQRFDKSAKQKHCIHTNKKPTHLLASARYTPVWALLCACKCMTCSFTECGMGL